MAEHPNKKLAMPSADELVAFEHGAAGHQGISSNSSGSLIIKPCTAAEIAFYESAKSHPLFQAHMPTFIGSLSENDDQDEANPVVEAAGGGAAAPGGGVVVTDPTPGLIKRATWKPSGGKKLSTGVAIVLENVTSGFKHPNVLDVKLGARLWDDDAPESKRRKLDEVAAETTSGSLGFRVAGMKVYTGEEGERTEDVVEVKDGYRSFNKMYGRNFNEHNVKEAFVTFLGGVTTDESGKEVLQKKYAKLIAERMLREVESVQYVLEHEESRMYSASVLMVYEGDEAALEVGLEEEAKGNKDGDQEPEGDEGDEDDENEIIPQKVHEMRLIDFAHASWTPGQGPDENALRGIRNVVKILREFV